ncbi:hypothetical protein ACEQ8H_000150 [Pleosporales sp. CAS-2024a]
MAPAVDAAPLRGPATNGPPRYLDMQPLQLHELPAHRDIKTTDGKEGPALAAFISSVLTEAYEIDFDSDEWISHGRFPGPRPDYVKMPPLSGTVSDPDINVLLHVEKRALGKDRSAWLGRKSLHSALDIGYAEMDDLLAQNHCYKEAVYTPSVLEANELLKWSEEELQKAVAELKPEWNIKTVQMSIFQMFHEMPKALRLSLLQNRVFHVLCLTAHSTGSTSALSQFHTLQLPVNMSSLQPIQSITSNSHVIPTSLQYNNPNGTERQKKQNGNKFTEGVYVSLERFTEGESEGAHRWDMMTKSDAKGITKLAPWSTLRKETLTVAAEDVRYVLDEIKKRRRAAMKDAAGAVAS